MTTGHTFSKLNQRHVVHNNNAKPFVHILENLAILKNFNNLTIHKLIMNNQLNLDKSVLYDFFK